MQLARVLAPPAALLLGFGLTLAAVPSALADHAGPNRAASPCPQPNGFSPGPTPSQYYQCSNNIPTLESCPSGLIWNLQGQYCDWPSSANNPG
ncbi:carbohydrate-binding module family 14 protein [Nocardia sp. NPDC046763]|uniref:carbohydrate-binding module family 14 protein n=1 Tax=Nocardia sp. NPDC046763 TaxID=3155256 RepID=UPI0033DC2DBB